MCCQVPNVCVLNWPRLHTEPEVCHVLVLLCSSGQPKCFVLHNECCRWAGLISESGVTASKPGCHLFTHMCSFIFFAGWRSHHGRAAHDAHKRQRGGHVITLSQQNNRLLFFFWAYDFICGWPRPVSSRSAKQPGWRSPPIVTIVTITTLSTATWMLVGFCHCAWQRSWLPTHN
jgi:hypothetical protein